MHDEYILGVVGSTVESMGAIASGNGEILCVKNGKGLNIQDFILEKFYNNINELLSNIRDECNSIDEKWLSSLSKIWFCCEGILNNYDVNIVRKCLHDTYLKKVTASSKNLTIAKHRGIAAHLATFWGKEGIIIKVGTGAFVYGRDFRGNDHRAGGWGPHVDDDGGGFQIGRAALTRLTAEYDGRIPTKSKFSYKMQQRLSLLLNNKEKQRTTETDIISWINRLRERADLRIGMSGLAIYVCDLAEKEKDITANSILHRAADKIYSSYKGVASRLNCAENVSVALQGGLLENSRVLAAMVRDRILEQNPNIRICRTRYRPVVGALIGGLNTLSYHPPIRKLKESIERVEGNAFSLFHATYSKSVIEEIKEEWQPNL